MALSMPCGGGVLGRGPMCDAWLGSGALSGSGDGRLGCVGFRVVSLQQQWGAGLFGRWASSGFYGCGASAPAGGRGRLFSRGRGRRPEALRVRVLGGLPFDAGWAAC